MTIGKNSKKSSVRSSIRAPKFLDKSNGFYGRLDEIDSTGKRTGEEMISGVVANTTPQNVIDFLGADEREEAEVFDCNEGMMEDDGETLLRREPGCRSSRWRRSRRSRSKQKTQRAVEASLSSDEDTRPTLQVELEKLKKKQDEMEKFGNRNDDDQVLIRDKKRGREKEAVEGKEERRMKKEQEEGMKMVKRSMMKNYRKNLDQALRRGWETFIANLYSVTLTPVPSSTSSPSSASQKKLQHNLVLAELH
ncbi:uncharacterized protein sb:cb1058 isoform X2 [Thalassophryne amazonica]|nr:uncharacterized protein sb:cb1058 isoform X2 [Thalassophryne amazonica]